MSLIRCPECGKDVSEKANSCPNCGCPISACVSFQQEIIDEKDRDCSPLIEYKNLTGVEKAGKILGQVILLYAYYTIYRRIRFCFTSFWNLPKTAICFGVLFVILVILNIILFKKEKYLNVKNSSQKNKTKYFLFIAFSIIYPIAVALIVRSQWLFIFLEDIFYHMPHR